MTWLLLIPAVAVGVLVCALVRGDHRDCRGRGVCRRCDTPIVAWTACALCREPIDDPAGAHDLGDDRRWHPWCCPDPECRRIEAEEGAW